ncbi:hypothetical protein [Escherichia coli]|nr:hypothetical protein [Escherichia coli]
MKFKYEGVYVTVVDETVMCYQIQFHGGAKLWIDKLCSRIEW